MSPAQIRSAAPVEGRRLFEREALRDVTELVVGIAVGSLIWLAVSSLTRLSV